ncbi:hypothetical protein Ancab_014170 [Ancistrocladus abbreviatus]
MASSSALFKLLCAVFLCMAVAAPLADAAITCGLVVSKVSPCLGYLQRNVPLPPACCAGIRSLNSLAKTTTDRQAACNCLKSLSSSASGINYPKAAGLPGKCGVSVGFPISPNTDCSKVH